MDEKAKKALALDALRRAANDAAWEARCQLESALLSSGVQDEESWADKAEEGAEGKVTPEFSAEGFKVTDRRAFEEWCVANGYGRLVWEVDEQQVMEGCVAYGGLAFFDGEEVPGLSALTVIPNGISLHPSQKAKDNAKEAIREYLR